MRYGIPEVRIFGPRHVQGAVCSECVVSGKRAEGERKPPQVL